MEIIINYLSWFLRAIQFLKQLQMQEWVGRINNMKNIGRRAVKIYLETARFQFEANYFLLVSNYSENLM